MIVSIPPSLSVADVVKRLKGASAHYLNHDQRRSSDEQFRWQRGYGVLTLGERQLPLAEAYGRRQKEHHGRQTTNAWLERVDEFDDGPPDDIDTSRQDRQPSASPRPIMRAQRYLKFRSSAL